MAEETGNQIQRRPSNAEEPKSLFKQVKALKRRGVESLMQKIGASDATVDPEYDESKRRFDRMLKEMNELATGMNAFLDRSHHMYTTCADLAEVTYEYYCGRLVVDWPGAPQNMKSQAAATKNKEAWHHSNEVIRRSAAKVWLDKGLTPLRAYMSATVPEIQGEADLRDAYVKDYDSYRRRVATLKEKQLKIGDPASQKAMDIEKDLTTLTAKLGAAEDHYINQNAKVKEDMIQAKVSRDETIESAVLTMVACQLEMFEQTTQMLSSLLQYLPAEKVEPLREQIQTLVAAGGPDIRSADAQGAEDEHKPKLSRSRQPSLEQQHHHINNSHNNNAAAAPGIGDSSRAGGGMTASTSRSAAPTTPTSVSTSVASSIGNLKKSLFSAATPKTPPVEAQPVASKPVEAQLPPPPPSSSSEVAAGIKPTNPLSSLPVSPPKMVMARALFDNEPDDESELAFTTGDILEILVQDDSGWWEARLNGRSGSIPANYVTLL